MSIQDIIKEIDGELDKLTKVRTALQPLAAPIVPSKPSKHRVKTGEHSTIYVMDASARERMSQAQKARWAKTNENKEARVQQGIKEAKDAEAVSSSRRRSTKKK